MELDKDEYTVGYARIAGGILVLTNIRLLIERGFRVFGKKKKSFPVKDITDLKFSKSFMFGTGIDIKYLEKDREHGLFIEFNVAAEAEDIVNKIRSLKNGITLTPVEIPKGEVERVSLEEAEEIALHFMEDRVGSLKVEETRHIAGAWNIVLSNEDKYAVVVGDDGKVEAWKKLTKFK